MNSSEHISALDGVRGVAIGLVLYWHFVVGQVGANYDKISHLLWNSGSATWAGVDLFFVLSGFLITGILIDNRASGTVFVTFYMRRVCRILPLYAALLGVFLVVVGLGLSWSDWLFGNPLPLASYLTLTQNFASARAGTLGPNWLSVTWSLAIEEQFYVCIPLVVVWLRRRHAVLLLSALLVLAPVLRSLIGGLGAYVYPLCRADSILIGALSAYALRSPVGMAIASRRFWLFVSFAILSVFAVLGPVSMRETGGVYNHLIFAVLGALVVVLAATSREESRFARLLSTRPTMWLGRHCYGIYLLHLPVLSIQEFFLETPYVVNSVKSFVVNLGLLLLTMFLAWTCFRYFENPFLKMGRRFKYLPATFRVEPQPSFE